MKEYSFGELFFTMDTCRLFIGYNPGTDKYNEIMTNSLRTLSRSFTPVVRPITYDNLEELNEITKSIIDTNGEEELFIKIHVRACYPSEVNEGLKANVLDKGYAFNVIRDALSSAAGEKAMSKPFNFPITSRNFRIEKEEGKIENPHSIAIDGIVVFDSWDKSEIEKFRDNAYLGTFTRQYMKQSSMDSELKYVSSDNSWRSSDTRIWDEFPVESVYRGLYTHFANPNVFNLTLKDSTAKHGEFQLTFLPRAEMDIERAVEAATGSLFPKDRFATACEVISVLTAVSNDKRLQQFVGLHYKNYEQKETEIDFMEDQSSFDSKVFFRLSKDWCHTANALSDVRNLILSCTRAKRLFTGLKDLLEDLEKKNVNVIQYAQEEFKRAIFANPFAFTGEEFKIKNDYARLMLSRNPKIRDLASLILSRIEEPEPDPEEEDEDLDDVGTIQVDGRMTIYEAEQAIKNAVDRMRNSISQYPKGIDSKISKNFLNAAHDIGIELKAEMLASDTEDYNEDEDNG